MRLRRNRSRPSSKRNLVAVASRGWWLFPQGAATECAPSQALSQRTFPGAPPGAHLPSISGSPPPKHFRQPTFPTAPPAAHPAHRWAPPATHRPKHFRQRTFSSAPSGTSEIATPSKRVHVKCIRWDEKCVWGTYPRRTLAPNIYVWRARRYGCRCHRKLPETRKVASDSRRNQQP